MVQTDNLGPFSSLERFRYSLHTPDNRLVRWSGSFEHDGQKFDLGSNRPTFMSMNSALLNTLRSQGHGVVYDHYTVKGGFNVEFEGKTSHCDVEIANHSCHFSGESFDQRGGNYLTLFENFLDSIGADRSSVQVTQEPYEVTLQTRAGAVPVNTVENTSSESNTQTVEDVPDEESSSEEGMFDLFG